MLSTVSRNGDGTFQAPIIYNSGGTYAVSVAIGDLNGDGKPDLAAVSQCNVKQVCTGGVVGVLLNTTPKATTIMVVLSSVNPSLVNQSVTFTAAITSTLPIPNGQIVTFFDGAAKIGTAPTKNGAASLTASFSIAKTHTIKAKYPGDSFHKPGLGTVMQVVNP